MRFFPIAFFLAGAFLTAGAQTDSLTRELRDSVLAVRQQLADLLLFEADSLRLADTLEQTALRRQIANLGAGDGLQAARLQTRLDSLQQVQAARLARLSRQMDSLRNETTGVPVLFSQDTLFYIYAELGPFSPGIRASNITSQLKILADDPLLDTNEIAVFGGGENHYVMYGEMIILSVTDRDAFWLGTGRKEVAEQYAATIRQSITNEKEQARFLHILTRIALLLLLLVAFYFGIRFMNRGLSWLNLKLLELGRRRFIKDIKIRNYKLMSARQEENLARKLLNILKWLIIGIVVYLALPVLFSIFPVTKPIANALVDLVLNPLTRFGTALIDYLPSLFTIVVVIIITHYFTLFLKSLAGEVEAGRLQLPGFYPEWATPTLNLLKLIIYAFAFIIIFPYLPGSDSPAFQGVSVFFGLLISLGSSSAISNIIAGLVIIYMRAFKIGDRVKIGDTTGDVIEKTMLVTRLRTIKNEDVTIPNSTILNGTTVNYSSNAEELGLILNSTVTIGYDVPWRKVHEMLINAALKTEHIREKPQPFVLQTSLDDFYVSYQINAYTDQPAIAARIYSQLHSNIQDAFNEAGIEILSPHYRAARDGNRMAIPEENLAPGYKSPAFNVNINQEKD